MLELVGYIILSVIAWIFLTSAIAVGIAISHWL